MTDQPFPAPPVTEDSRPYWDFVRAGEWRMQQCGACDVFRFPPGAICRSCASTEFTWAPVPPTGTIVARTIVHRPPNPDFAGRVPYVLAIVELAEGLRLVAFVEGDAPVVGDRVALSRAPAGDGMRLPVFVPTDGKGH